MENLLLVSIWAALAPQRPNVRGSAPTPPKSPPPAPRGHVEHVGNILVFRGIQGSSQVLHGSPWSFVVSHDIPGYAMVFHGTPLFIMVCHVIPWISLCAIVYHGIPWYTMVYQVYYGKRQDVPCFTMRPYHGISRYTRWCIMGYHGLPWYSVVCYGILWYTMIHHGTPWYVIVHHGIPWYTYTMVYSDLPWYTMIYHGKASRCTVCHHKKTGVSFPRGSSFHVSS